MLILTCLITPYSLAFQQDEDRYQSLVILDAIVNVCFFIDLLISFLSPYYDEEFNLIDEYRVSVFPIINKIQLIAR